MQNSWQPPLQKPTRLSRGDRVAIVTPCWGGPNAFPHRYKAGKEQLIAQYDFDVVEMQHTRTDSEWLKHNPKARADDLMAAFADPSIKAIISSIGGDDAERLIPFIDLAVVTANPKVFLGYSDTTVLSFGFLKAGLVSFYGPAIMSGFAENGRPHPYLLNSLERTLFSSKAVGLVEPSREGWTAEQLPWADPLNQSRQRTRQPFTGPRVLSGNGKASGHLIGGCADTLERIKGTDWWPPLEVWRNGLLFYETSEDAPRPDIVAQWLRDFGTRGILQVLSGVLFGRPGGRIDPARHVDYDHALLQILSEFGLENLPVLANLDFGHTDPMFTLPYGTQAEINCETTELTITDSAVS